MIEAVTVSVAVMVVLLGAPFRVAENVPVPLVSVLLAGSPAPRGSLLVKCTVPA